MGLFFRVKTTSLEGAAGVLVSYVTLSELKKNLKIFRAETPRKEENLQGTRYWSLAQNISGKPQFVSVDLLLRPVVISIRMVSKKEYYHAKEQERLDNQTAWEAYGERKLGC